MKPENIQNIQEIDIIKVFNNPSWFEQIKNAGLGLADNFKNPDFSFFGELLTKSPSEALASGLSILLLIPVLNFAASFLQTRLTKVINKATMGDQANSGGMKFMEYAMPLLIVWMSYTMYSALGLYWIFQSVLGIGQMIVLAKIYPLPKITEEEYEQARLQYGGVKKKKKKKPVVEVEDDAESDSDSDVIEVEANEVEKVKKLPAAEIKDEKYISKEIPKGINQNAKNNYQKTGKKYTIKKRKK